MKIDVKKNRIVLVADTPRWAYDNISQNIQKYLGGTYDIRIVYAVNYKDFNDAFLDIFCFKETNHIHFFWRDYLFSMLKGLSENSIATHLPIDKALDRFCEKILSFSIYDHLYLSNEEIAAYQDLFAVVDAYSVCSQRLFEIYKKKVPIDPDIVIEDGVDLELFLPKNVKRFQETDRDLMVGWAGYSRWHLSSNEDPKGLHTILKPAIRLLQNRDVPIKGIYADVSEKIRPRSEMPNFYNSIDVLVCASFVEGTPNPVLEAMACGVPIISTDVGIVPEVFGPLQKQYILTERTVEAMAEKLAYLAQNRFILSKLSNENRQQIQHWNWANHMTKWMFLFKLASARCDMRTMRRKRWLLQRYMMSKSSPKRFNVKEHLRKAAYRIHPDTLFWRNLKNRALKPFRRLRKRGS